MIQNTNDIVNAELNGAVREYMFRKNPSQVTVTGYWFDLSMSAGNPPPKYWFDSAPLTGVQVKQSTDGGFFHGSPVAPQTMYLRKLNLMTSTSTALPMSFRLMDYLLYYPTIDDSAVGETAITSIFNVLSTFTTPTPPSRQTNILTLTNNLLEPYTQVQVSSTGTLPAGLSPSTSYWSIPVTATTCKLATSRADAVLNRHITISDSGSGVHSLRTILPRYTDGKGVQIMPVTLTGRTGGFTFNVTYTNSSGVAGRVSQTVMQNDQQYIGCITTSHPAGAGNYGGAFIGLQGTDTGVQSIESVNMITGDTGTMSLILVYPLADSILKEITAPMERDFYLDGQTLPIIKDDAYISAICSPLATLAATGLIGSVKVIWN